MTPVLARALVIAGVCTPAWAEIAGIPDPPTPGPVPTLWASFSDDLLGDGILNTDDFRTGNVSMGMDLGWLVLGGDYSVLTHRIQPSYTQGMRSDEITLTAGVRLDDWLPESWRERSVLIGGVGVRIDGVLGGEDVQNAFHRSFGYPQTALAYDHAGQASKGLAYIYGSLDSDGVRIVRDLAPVIAQLDGAALGTMGGEYQSYLGVDLAMIGREGAAWLGARYQWNAGMPGSPTAEVVAHHEAGPSLTFGLAKVDGVYLSMDFNPHTLGIDGTIGYSYGGISTPGLPARAIPAGAPEHVITNQDIQYTPGGESLGLQMHGPLPVDWLQQISGPPYACEWVVDYHFGTDQSYHWYGNDVDVDQLIAGLEPEFSYALAWPAIQLQPFGLVGAGARLERVKVSATGSRFAQATGGEPVVQAGIGVRMRLFGAGQTQQHWYQRIWLGYEYDFWHPLHDRPIASAGDESAFLRPGMGGEYSLGFSIDW